MSESREQAAVMGRMQGRCGRGLAGFLRGMFQLGVTVALFVCVWSVSMTGLIGGGEALAATGHRFLSSLSEGPAGVDLVAPGAVAVDHATGQVFMGDRGSGYVDVYSSAGGYVTRVGEGLVEASGVAVDEASGDVYVADSSRDVVLVYGPDGTGGYRLLGRWFGQNARGGAFGGVAGVAVDNSTGPSAGDVYVVEEQGLATMYGVVDVFRPRLNTGEGVEEGELLRRLESPVLEEPSGVAVSAATGRVLVADSFKGAVYTYDDEGSYEGKLTGKGSPYGSFSQGALFGDVAGVAVDEGTGDVYVAEAEWHAVSQYGPTGEWKGWITSIPTGDLGEPQGVAVTTAGEVFVADAGRGVLDRFGASAPVPSVETVKIAKSALTRTSAVLPGTIDGEGKAASYRFQYGETVTFGQETAAKEASGTTLQAVSAMVEGLHAGRVYYYRIVGENENGSDYGTVGELETRPAVEKLETGAVMNVAPESVSVTGSLRRGGLATRYYFQYGTSGAYGSVSPEPPANAPAGETEKEEKEVKTVQASVTGLSPNTLYHYRLVAENEEYGTTYGQDRTFTTSGPPRISYEPVTGVGQEQVTLNARIDPDQIATSYRFQYGETTSYGTDLPAEGEAVGSGAGFVPVSAIAAGLHVGTTYHFRVVAENEAGTTYGEDRTVTTVAPAPVDALFVTNIGATSAIVHTTINPLEHDTHYYVEYGTQSCRVNPGTCTEIPSSPGEDIGEGTEDVAREVKLIELSPGTTYHYRVVATNSLGRTEGPERTFATGEEHVTFALPDGRAWEMVTPPNKEGAPVEALTREGGLILASVNGDALTYLAYNGLGEEVQGNRSPEPQQIFATRGSNAWSSKDIATPNSRTKGVNPGSAPEYQFFNPDLTAALVDPAELSGGNAEPPLVPGVTQATIYLRDSASGTYLPLVSEANTAAGTKFGGKLQFVSASPDLKHVVMSSTGPLLGAGTTAGLYEWSGGRLSFVSVLPHGVPSSPAELGFYHSAAHAISNDGSRIIWTKKEESTAAGHLYLRDTVKGQTVQLDAAQGVVEPSKGSAEFQWASGSASRVLFTDKQRLTPDSTAEPGGESPSADLYECVVVEENGKIVCQLHDLTVDGNQGEHSAVQYFVLGASEDATTVYWIAHGVLASNQNGNGEAAQAGAANLYELHYDGTRWTTLFIAKLSQEDSQEWEGFHVGNTAYLTARVSPNGRYLAFMSSAAITGYDNVDANPEAKGARDEEVFLYDSATPSLRCVSCDPSGARPEGVLDLEETPEGLGLLVDRREVWLGHRLAGNIPGWTAQNLVSALFQSRYLSNEGRLYFNSPDDLVPAAENHKEDVYEYEPSGVGGCQSPSGGCVSLISGGTSDRESAFIEATPDGSSVFFLTEAQLLPQQDTDTAFDIYDARECTPLSPCLTAPQGEEAPCAEAKTCRPAETAQQIPGIATRTSTVTPSGSIVSPPPPPKQGVEARKKTMTLTRTQKLKRALHSCRKLHAHSRRKRKRCERTARKHYGNKHAGAKKAKRHKPRRSRSQGARS
jgi:hypothetical protein